MTSLGLESILYAKNIMWGFSNDFHPGYVRDEYYAKYPINKKTTIILAVARLEEDKGIGNLICAIASLIKTNPNCYLLIKGDGPLYTQYLNLIKELKLEQSIMILKDKISRSELIKLYQLCDIFILPSERDLMPFSIGEAMMTGKPVISTKNAVAEDFIRTNRTGIMIERSDSTLLLNSLQSLINDSEKFKQLGLNARSTALDNFAINNVANQLISAFKTIKIPKNDSK
jgi:glycosyltransferase involved in cell wall biosynthesis